MSGERKREPIDPLGVTVGAIFIIALIIKYSGIM